ncbi:unnamed protein product [Acanthoscelides obtectus]|uniref:Uncharacterized protein n=1 Tax=Acanthoscelides obtectus TaxID=200917 RepID=A0A9P0M3I0_ACAOB|nr:unnamed protein product [Acanthoscelides obtectus]CAK1656954.1 hypothetical protein AOBTE_LOCUS20040 [Acanthoscelides obtectus]
MLFFVDFGGCLNLRCLFARAIVSADPRGLVSQNGNIDHYSLTRIFYRVLPKLWSCMLG